MSLVDGESWETKGRRLSEIEMKAHYTAVHAFDNDSQDSDADLPPLESASGAPIVTLSAADTHPTPRTWQRETSSSDTGNSTTSSNSLMRPVLTTTTSTSSVASQPPQPSLPPISSSSTTTKDDSDDDINIISVITKGPRRPAPSSSTSMSTFTRMSDGTGTILGNQTYFPPSANTSASDWHSRFGGSLVPLRAYSRLGPSHEDPRDSHGTGTSGYPSLNGTSSGSISSRSSSVPSQRSGVAAAIAIATGLDPTIPSLRRMGYEGTSMSLLGNGGGGGSRYSSGGSSGEFTPSGSNGTETSSNDDFVHVRMFFLAPLPMLDTSSPPTTAERADGAREHTSGTRQEGLHASDSTTEADRMSTTTVESPSHRDSSSSESLSGEIRQGDRGERSGSEPSDEKSNPLPLGSKLVPGGVGSSGYYLTLDQIRRSPRQSLYVQMTPYVEPIRLDQLKDHGVQLRLQIVKEKKSKYATQLAPAVVELDDDDDNVGSNATSTNNSSSGSGSGSGSESGNGSSNDTSRSNSSSSGNSGNGSGNSTQQNKGSEAEDDIEITRSRKTFRYEQAFSTAVCPTLDDALLPIAGSPPITTTSGTSAYPNGYSTRASYLGGSDYGSARGHPYPWGDTSIDNVGPLRYSYDMLSRMNVHPSGGISDIEGLRSIYDPQRDIEERARNQVREQALAQLLAAQRRKRARDAAILGADHPMAKRARLASNSNMPGGVASRGALGSGARVGSSDRSNGNVEHIDDAGMDHQDHGNDNDGNNDDDGNDGDDNDSDDVDSAEQRAMETLVTAHTNGKSVSAMTDEEKNAKFRELFWQHVTCPVCLDKVTAPASTACGHMFCYECVTQAVRSKKQCPMCRKNQRLSDIRRLYI